ncbi:MAG: VWA domain-containing protein [Chloroflexota bacterium]
MAFVWPVMLLALLLVPVGYFAYRRIERRRLQRAAAYGGLVAKARISRSPGRVRGRIPGACFLLGIAVLLLSLARPQATLGLPRLEGTVILAFDVSGSMAATDLQPTRIDAAKAAARAFVQEQPPGVVIGVVAFSDSGFSVQTPTSDEQAILAAINRLRPQRGTSLAQGILESLDTIERAERAGDTDFYNNSSPDPTPEPTPVPPGTHAPAVIVLLTDGENNEQPDPVAAAQVAADRGVRINPIAIGSTEGATLNIEGFRVHTQLNEPTLQQVAAVTDGTYLTATTSDELAKVYQSLDTHLVVRPEAVEVTALLAGLGLVVLIAGAVTSLLWRGRLP